MCIRDRPDTERSLAPSALKMAVDLGTTLDIIAGVRLGPGTVSYTHLRAHETVLDIVCRLLLEKKKNKRKKHNNKYHK